MAASAPRAREGQGASRLAQLARGLARRLLRRGPVEAPPAAKVCGCPADAQGVPFGATFHDILVMPGESDPADINCIPGGPVWPDYEAQTWVRHRRRNKVTDRLGVRPQISEETLSGDFVWGGAIRYHFGHLSAEMLTRLLWSLQRWPEATYLFAVKDTESGAEPPGYFWQILAHLGLPKAQVRLVLKPVTVQRLHVMPQAEQVRWLRKTPKSYLRLLQPVTQRVLRDAVPSDLLYVSRIGMIENQSGAHAGESYLVQLLDRLGVATMDPSREGFDQQMRRYAGARTMVFAEGSALHGRQLLGRIEQDCVILNRRPGNRKTGFMLGSRLRALRYVETCAHFVAPTHRDGLWKAHVGLSFYDVPVLQKAFADLGIDLTAHWDEAEFRQHQERDAALWLDLQLGRSLNVDRSVGLDQIAQVFRLVGLTELAAKAENLALEPAQAQEKAS